jgi:homoserine O-acetyltransferase
MSQDHIVETRILRIDRPFRLESGDIMSHLEIAYETYGTLNTTADNAILIEHALSGNAHAAFFHESDTKPGWWDVMIGPGKAFDTDKYYVICTNVLGGCSGTTGPASANPATNKPYALTFPPITIRDMVDVQRLLLLELVAAMLLSVQARLIWLAESEAAESPLGAASKVNVPAIFE